MTELTADFSRALPGGGMDDSTYEAIESALDSVGAPLTDKPLSAGGRFLTLAERVFALEAERVTALAASPASPAERPALPRDADKTERVRDREVIARIIDPSSWAVLDSYLAETKRKLAGKNAGYDPDNFKDKASLAKADAILSALAVGGISSVAGLPAHVADATATDTHSRTGKED